MAKPPVDRATPLMCGIDGRAVGKSDAAPSGLPCDEPLPERKSNQLLLPSALGCRPPAMAGVRDCLHLRGEIRTTVLLILLTTRMDRPVK